MGVHDPPVPTGRVTQPLLPADRPGVLDVLLAGNVLDDRRQHLAPMADMPVQRRRVRPQATGKSPRREPGQAHVVQQLNASSHHVAWCQRATGGPRSGVPFVWHPRAESTGAGKRTAAPYRRPREACPRTAHLTPGRKKGDPISNEPGL